MIDSGLSSTAMTEESWFELGSIGLIFPDAALVDLRCEIRESDGKLGTTGTIGDVRCTGFWIALDSEGTCRVGGICKVTAEEGVVGWVESASDGACEVVGVADPDCTSTDTELSADTVVPGIVELSSVTVSSGMTDSVLGGNSTGIFAD